METLEQSELPSELSVVSLTAGADAVRRYSELTADFNPIHLDSAFAARTAFGLPIIHGTLGLNLIIEAIERTFGVLPEGVAVDIRFVRPVPVGSTIKAGGRLRDPATGIYDVYVETQSSERAVEGTCTIGPTPGNQNREAIAK